jgi:hypothetical protein
MSFVRVLSLVMVLSAQALASGGGALLRVCEMGGETAMRHCPCAEKVKAERARHPGSQLDRASCCAIERSPAEQAPVATVAFHPDSVEVPALAPVRLPRLVPVAAAIDVIQREGPRAQGPPVFLKVRSLLL